MAFPSDAQWAAYKQVIDNFHDDAFQDDIVWKRQVTTRDPNGETSNERFVSVNLKGLVQYNYFRSWPMNQQTPSGELDKESVLVYLNNQYLEDEGHLDLNKQFEFDPGVDRFVLRGRVYKALGDSHAAQAKNTPLLTFLILKREETSTGDNQYDNE